MSIRKALCTMAFCLIAGSALGESRVYDLAKFDGISVSGGISAVVDVGGAQAVSAEAATAAMLERLEVTVRGTTLEIGFRNRFLDWLFNFGQGKSVTVHVTVPALASAVAGSGSDLDVTKMAGSSLNLNVSSGASISAKDVSGGHVSADSSSGASLSISGKCQDMIASASSGADIGARDFRCARVDVDASSGGQASVSAEVSIDAEASSGGTILVYGGAADVRSDTSSGGSVRFVK